MRDGGTLWRACNSAPCATIHGTRSSCSGCRRGQPRAWDASRGACTRHVLCTNCAPVYKTVGGLIDKARGSGGAIAGDDAWVAWQRDGSLVCRRAARMLRSVRCCAIPQQAAALASHASVHLVIVPMSPRNQHAAEGGRRAVKECCVLRGQHVRRQVHLGGWRTIWCAAQPGLAVWLPCAPLYANVRLVVNTLNMLCCRLCIGTHTHTHAHRQPRPSVHLCWDE